ncbi:lipopolysaccharide-induced tumor necrosis factor-alpha factor homolog isoform X1 [Teleopsis dalmanni]|uniref:lipopolysaccharide-induced tumor necrosis factor-alpha factor homolog isoform X1 n=1 Tax=Teleopsis dalmanni TaxID=139649 RepID=UPI0018CE35E6|nr:lipopolysaccharide-induced tumor necrosis factor-alpha factor homolog isoform X1 [Teleopsis dalmanni]
MSYQNPPPYSATQQQPGFTPASYYQPPPQQPLYPPMPQPPPQQSTVIIQTTTPAFVPIGSGPSHITCPSCHAQVLTTVKSEANTRTHCWALLLCLIGLWPCVCLPYCMDSCQNSNHYCPNCNAYIGTYQS